MSNISISISMMNPEEEGIVERVLNCYESFADEVKIIGKDFPYEFKWDYFRKIFQEAFNECRVVGFSEWMLIIFFMKKT